MATDDGDLMLENGGAKLTIGDDLVVDGKDIEYPGLYTRFAALVGEGASDVDVTPLRHVADAFMVGRHVRTDDFDD